MANSRLERIGTIFTRTHALLKTGAKQPHDKPLWFDVYKAFPPKLEPTYARAAPNVDIRPIFYDEDRIRSRFHKSVRQSQTIALNTPRQSESQMFIEIYKKLEAQGPLSADKIFETAQEMMQERMEKEREERSSTVGRDEVPGLTERFSMAAASGAPSGDPQTNVNIKDIFKD